MSRFSEKLKVLIEECGFSIYQLAKNSELDRTTIQRSISGERLPGIAFVEKLCDYLRVSPSERKDVMELYSIDKIGEKTYAARVYIKKIVEQVATLRLTNIDDIHFQRTVSISGDIHHEIKIFTGQYSVNNLVRDVLEDEIFNIDTPHIGMTIPFEYTYLFDCLKQYYWRSNGKINIEHIVRLSKNPHIQQNSNANLEIVSNILPFAFCIGNGYQPYYYYVTADISKDITLFMPYYFYTSNSLVTISSDFKSAILYNNLDIKNAYHNEFRKCLTHTKPIVRQLSSCFDMISTYLNAFQNAGEITNAMEPQPCFAKYYTPKMVDDHLRLDVPNRDAVREGICKIYSSYQSFYPSVNTYFSIEGLASLTQTGIMNDLPARFALPFTVEERLFLLRSLKNDIEKDLFIARITDSSKFSISSLTSIQIYKNSGIVLIVNDDNGIVSCFIEEKSICDAFTDFFESLPDSGLVYGKEETIKTLEEFIKQLEQAYTGK